MRRARLCALVTIAATLTVAAAPAARTSSPNPLQTRDTTPQGAGAIAGTLVASDTGGPVRGGRVLLKNSAGSEPLLITTDDQGAFTFTGLPAGRYELSASGTGFVSVSYGEKRPGFGGPGTSIVLAERQRIERLTFAMPRAGALTGVVLNEFGEPAIGAAVRAGRYVTIAGRRRLVTAGIAEADDRGVYRIFLLPPGEYIVEVPPPVLVTRSEAFLGGMAAAGKPTATNQRVLSVFRPEAEGSPRAGYVTTFYPGSSALSSAQWIPLGVGEVRSGIDIRLQRVQLARVSGTVRDVDGSIPRAELQLRSAFVTNTESAEGRTWTTHLGSDGRFSFTGIPPGQYSLAARGQPLEVSTDADVRWAIQDVTLAGANIDGLALTLQGGLTVSGTIVTDAGALPEIPGHVNFAPTEDTRFMAGPSWLKWAAIGSGGRFTASSLVPGRYVVSLSQDVPGWSLASAVFGGRDALDFLLEVRAGESSTGLLTLTKRSAELSGTLFNTENASTRTFTVVVFAADERYWLPDNRRNQAVALDTDGRFAFRNLPPGNYRLAAVEDFDATAGIDAVLLRELAAAPTIPVTITAGERKTQDLRIK